MDELNRNDRNFFHGNNQNQMNQERPVVNTASVSIAKVFLYMFGLILITAVVAFGVGAVVYYNLINGANVEEFFNTYLIILVISGIALFIDMLVINLVSMKGKHGILIPGIIYAILVGVLFSLLTIIVDWEIIGAAFGITALAFGVMALIAFLSKGNMKPIAIVIVGLFSGIILLTLTNFLITLITGTSIGVIGWIVSFAIFALVMFVTIFDLWRMKQICEKGAMSKNLTQYFAFVMYVDFINIFVRILYYLIIIFGKRK